jgi:hypothetical protein
VAATIAAQNVKQELPTLPEHLRSHPHHPGTHCVLDHGNRHQYPVLLGDDTYQKYVVNNR